MSSLEPITRRRPRSHGGRRLATYLVALAPVVAAAGCGSAGPTGGSAHSGSGPVAAAYRYARCMRSHGVSGFPDPHVSTTPGGVAISQEAAPVASGQAPVFTAAEHACRGILRAINAQAGRHGPGAGVLLAFAKCLRAHGLGDFPDPDRTGQITRSMLSAAGVDLHSPMFLSAAKSCIGVTHGAITPAEIRAAISGPH